MTLRLKTYFSTSVPGVQDLNPVFRVLNQVVHRSLFRVLGSTFSGYLSKVYGEGRQGGTVLDRTESEGCPVDSTKLLYTSGRSPVSRLDVGRLLVNDTRSVTGSGGPNPFFVLSVPGK